MTDETFTLSDSVPNLVVRHKKERKIKSKPETFKNIRSTWAKRKSLKLQNDLNAAKEDLVKTEIPVTEMEKNAVNDKLMQKTSVIARLEGQIKFLSTGEKTSIKKESMRAIKLKNNMITNMIANCDQIYSLPEAQYENIFKPAPEETAAEETDEIQKQIVRTVERIIEDKKSADSKIKAPSREEIKETVDKKFAEAEEEVATNQQIQEEAILPPVANFEESQSEITSTQIADEINQQLDETKIETTTPKNNVEDDEIQTEAILPISAAAVKQQYTNNNVAEDGTYRMSKQEIKDRILYLKLKFISTHNQLVQMQAEQKYENFVEELKNQQKHIADAQVEETQIEQIPAEEREMPLIAPTREEIEDQAKVISEEIDKSESVSDIKEIMEKVAKLKAAQEAVANKKREAMKSREKLENEKQKAVADLLRYSQELQEGVQETKETVADMEAGNNALANDIEEIRNAMGRTK